MNDPKKKTRLLPRKLVNSNLKETAQKFESETVKRLISQITTGVTPTDEETWTVFEKEIRIKNRLRKVGLSRFGTREKKESLLVQIGHFCSLVVSITLIFFQGEAFLKKDFEKPIDTSSLGPFPYGVCNFSLVCWVGSTTRDPSELNTKRFWVRH